MAMAIKLVTCTISAGQSLSHGVDCSGCLRLVRINVPANWTPAPMTFQMSTDGVAYHNLYNITLPGDSYRSYEATVQSVAPGSSIHMPSGLGQDIAWVKVRSGTAGVPVIQPADATFGFELVMPDTIAATAAAPAEEPAMAP
jgi:hypothetical protein